MTVLDYVNALRAEEIRRVLDRHRDLFEDRDLLEIGGGTGAQLRLLAGVCRSAVGIEIRNSQYAPHRLVKMYEYDGRRIPFPDASFDTVFSSNVIEHIRDEATVHSEMRRVLRSGGVAAHIVPTHHWRLWTSIIHYPALPKKFMARLRLEGGSTEVNPPPANIKWRARLWNALVSAHHGEFGNRFTEYFIFRPSAWRKRFEAHGWSVETVEPLGMIYTGNCLFAGHISLRARSWWAGLLGSATVLLIMRPR